MMIIFNVNHGNLFFCGVPGPCRKMSRGTLELVPSLLRRSAPTPSLWVVTCYFNPCNFAARRQNYRRFRAGLARQNVPVLLVELAASDARGGVRESALRAPAPTSTRKQLVRTA